MLNDLKSINITEDNLPLSVIRINVLVVTTGYRVTYNYKCQIRRALEGPWTLIITPVKSASGLDLSSCWCKATVSDHPDRENLLTEWQKNGTHGWQTHRVPFKTNISAWKLPPLGKHPTCRLHWTPIERATRKLSSTRKLLV